jgi:hypothetical protein
LSQPLGATFRAGGDIIGDQDVHGVVLGSLFLVPSWLFPKKGGIRIVVAAQVPRQ